MKKIILSITIALLSFTTIQAQDIHLNLYSNYVFDDKFENINSDASFLNGKIKGGYQWGVGIEYMANPDYGIEILYHRQDTDVPVNYYTNLVVDRKIPASVNYIMLGGVRYAGNEKVQGYGGLMVGTVIYDNKEPVLDEPDNAVKFAWGVRLGANIWVSEKVGIKLQSHLLSGIQAFGGGFYFGTGGAGGGASAFSTLYQFSLGGGLVIRLGGE
jgi:hypothetical protein